MPRISVVVPVYNTEEYLAHCVRSILTQSYCDFELILVNDGSNDRSGIMCDEYVKYDNRVKALHKENGGVSSARNLGIREAIGEYITFIDSDDWVQEDYLSVLYDGIARYDADMCVTSIQTVVSNQVTSGRIEKEYYLLSRRDAINYYGKRQQFRGPMAKLVRTSIAKKMPFPDGRSIAEDLATNCKYFDAAKKIVRNDSQLYFYRMNNQSLTNKKYSIDRLGGLSTLEELMIFFEKNEYPILYKHFWQEYCYDIFRQYCNVHKYYDDSRTESMLWKKLEGAIGTELPGGVYTVEKLLTYLADPKLKYVYDTFVVYYLNDLVREIDPRGTGASNSVLTDRAREKLKKLIRKNCIRCQIWPRNYPQAYNCCYPVLMRIYWDCAGVISRIRKRIT